MIYIHIPFCKSRCLYCDFFSTTSSDLKDDFVKALLKETEGRAEELRFARANTIYIGGGTPSQLDAKHLTDIFGALQRVAPLQEDAEVTIECNPDDVTPEFVDALKATPVNRVSMGVQTFNDNLLRLLRRRHTSAQAHRAVSLLREAGYGNLSLDLMYGLPGQTMEMWRKDVDEILSLHVPHLSAYSLQWEEGTPLYRMLERGEVAEASDEVSRGMYEYIVKATAMYSMEHYEVSNFAMPGMRARHNSGYWRDEPYVGLGPGAHSYDGANVRSSNPSDLKAYIMSDGMPEREVEVLDEDCLYEEKVLKGLRTIDGLDLSTLKPKYREYAMKMAELHIKSGRMVQCGDVLRLTEDGIFVSNDIMSDMML